MKTNQSLYPRYGTQFNCFTTKGVKPVSIKVERKHQYPRDFLEITVILDVKLVYGTISAKVKAFSKRKEIYESKFIRLKHKYKRKIIIRVKKDTRKPIDKIQITTHRPAILSIHIRAK